MSQNFSNWEKPKPDPDPDPEPDPASKTHLVWGWDYQLFCKREWETLTRPIPGLGWGWERDLYN